MQAYREKGVMFLAGFGIACLLALSVGAARQQVNQPDRYDANFVMGGIALQIVDHHTNTLYIYGPNGEKGDEAAYALGRAIDLTLAGQAEIRWEDHENDDAQDR